MRIGGDVNVFPDKFAIRGGGYYQTAAQPNQYSQYQNIDFAGQWEFGLALGFTTRIYLDGIISSASKTSAIELSAGFGHTFVGTSQYITTNPQQSQLTGVHGLAGTQCNTSVAGNSSVPNAAGYCSDGVQSNRTEWPVNLGTITNSFNQINLGATYRF